MADATPVFYVAGTVLVLLALWAVYVALRPGPRWAQPPAPQNPEPRDR